ncbi:MAG TPA: hypothetical protein VMU92_11515 [Acidobacteriaceae bacterium]|nr:hypothetical protein [Acidobacteriaceae bacterium]
MHRERLKRLVLPVLVLFASLWFSFQGTCVAHAQGLHQADSEKSFIAWQSPGKLHHIVGGEEGTLSISPAGIEFKARNGSTLNWAFQDVQTFRISPRRLALETYQNRKWHLPGVTRYRFDLDQAVPPRVAAELAREVQRPSQNAVPYTQSQGMIIAAHHRTLTHGTNGVLRFRGDGIDYVTSTAGDSRSWRWADLETVSNPDPWHLFVFGYRDTYAFDLKQQISRKMLNHISDEIWAHNQNELKAAPEALTPGTTGHNGRRGDE